MNQDMSRLEINYQSKNIRHTWMGIERKLLVLVPIRVKSKPNLNLMILDIMEKMLG